MPTNIKTFTAAGVDAAWIARLNSDGYPAGITGTLANGSDTGMHAMKGVQSVNLETPEGEIVDIPGDNGVIGSFQFAPQQTPRGSLELGVSDADVIANALGTNVYTDGDAEWVVVQPVDLTYQDMWLVTNAPAKSNDVGSVGNAGFEVRVHKVQIQPRNGNQQTASGTTNPYQVVEQPIDVLPWGEAFSTVNQGTTSGYGYKSFFENRVTLHTLIGDGSTNTVTLDKTAAADNGNKVVVYKNGTKMTYNASPSDATEYSVSTTNGVTAVTLGTLAADVADGDDIVIRYEYTQ